MRTIYTLVFLLAGSCLADTLTLRNGQVVNGQFLGATARQIRMETGGQIQTFEISDVSALVFAGGAPEAIPAAPNYQQPAQQQPPQAYMPPPAPAAGFELRAGTRLVVRMIDAVDSEHASLGQTFRGSMEEPVFLNGQPVIPRGADVMLRLVDAKESGKLAGRSTLTLSLQSVLVNGRMMDVNTQSFTVASSSRGARTAKMGLGGAGVGAAIGAIAGGGKGAAIGAGAGGAAGVGVEVLTRGQRVRIPSETRLSFTLDTSVRM